MARVLLGPCDDPVWIDQFVGAPLAAGRWAPFGTRCRSWEAAAGQLGGEPPDALLVWPSYASVPAWAWAAPVPVVALAADPNLLWSGYRHRLPHADLVLTDAPAAEKLRRAGLEHVRAANLYGLDRHFAAGLDAPEAERDLDVVFAGNVSPTVQGDRLPWLGRLAALGARFRVHIAAGVFGAEYRALLRRAKLAFNRSVRGECNLRALEAAASGAVLLQEADNAEVPSYLEPGTEFVPYTDTNFETVVADLLADADKRRAIAAAARARARGFTFEALIEAALAVGGPGWDEVRERARQRAARPTPLSRSGRVWQRAARGGPDADPELVAELSAAGESHALGVLARDPAGAELHLAAAAAAGNRVSALGRALALAELGRTAEALAAGRSLVAELDANPEFTAAEADSVPYPARFDWVRVGWDRAGFEHPDDPGAARREQARLVRGRTLELIAACTGTAEDHATAVACCPEQAHLRAALGAALVRADKPEEAVEHLRFAVVHDPFDRASAAALIGALDTAGRAEDAERVRADRRVLAAAAPDLMAGPVARPAPVNRPSAPTSFPAPGHPPSRRARFVDLDREQFVARFGSPDTAGARPGSAAPLDTHAVLALALHVRARRVLEIGPAPGSMVDNLTAFTAPDAVVYTLATAPHPADAVRRDPAPESADPSGTAHKAQFLTADPRHFDFARLGTLDLVLLDGARDRAAGGAGARGAYPALRPGGCLVLHEPPGPAPQSDVEQGLAALGLPEPVYRVAGTRVAFLMKGEGLGAAAGADSARIAVTWDGAFKGDDDLPGTSRAVCTELAARGHQLGLVPRTGRDGPAARGVLPTELAALVGREHPGAVHVRHRPDPDFTPPPGSGPFVLMHEWAFGRVPRAWIDPLLASVDELWVPSRAVLRAFVASGVPEHRIALVPPGIDPDRFRPGLEPLPLATAKRAKFLFAGTAGPRGGLDALLGAYRRAFARADDVCLVIRGSGTGAAREGAGDALVRTFRTDPDAPEVLDLTAELAESDVPRLFAACDALVAPYRAEAFGLPVLGALACGLPVVVTAGGPTDEFVPPAAGWRVPARLRYFEHEAVGSVPTAGRPWWLEPDPDALVAILRDVVSSADARAARGAAGRRAALGWSWARTAAAIEDRVRVLRARTPVRAAQLHAPAPAVRPGAAAETELVSLVVLCCNELEVTRLCVASVLAHTRAPYELILVDNGSTDGTPAYLDALVGVPGPARVVVVHNPENRGYPAGVNQGLGAARGAFLVLLNNDVVVTPGWLDRLVRCATAGARPGLAGAVTNYAPPPQLVEPGYADLTGLDAFAAARATAFAGRTLDVPRLTGFCLLVPRLVFEHIGRLDEGFGLGFFDDDDLCLRARRAGFGLAVALDCYVHHFGSTTFRGLGVDTGKQLTENLALYRAKWGADEAARYAAPAPVPNGNPARPVVPAVAGRNPRVSLTMIVRNEEHNLGACLESVRDLVDEAVVIDTGSADRTVEIARSFGCVVGEFPWVDHFAAARNAALERATGDYAFWMDADDRLDPENRDKLRALLAGLSGANEAFVMKCLCVPDRPGAGATAVDHVRLFRLHPAHRWTYRVHEQILPALRSTGAEVKWSEVCVRHVGYVDPAVRRRKLDRDLRLLKLDAAEKPGDPFTLFNLGSIYHETGDFAAAAAALEQSLAGSHVKDSIVRKTYALLARCQHQGGSAKRAEATCRLGRTHYPDDAELVFLAAGLARETGDPRAAEGLYRKLIDGAEAPHFASVDTGLRAVKGRHNLAVLLLEQDRLPEAEGLWRAALVHDPHFLPAQVGLGEVCVKAGNEAGLARQLAALGEAGEVGAAEAAVLSARWKGARGDHPGAIAVLEEAVTRLPGSLSLRMALSHARIAADAAPEALEAAFRGVLELDPTNEQAKRNLEVLYRKTGRWVEGVLDGAPGA
ncbi:glycosyltransferase [Gemmata sp. G18]|uniref:Glycosyltransferase n=1 Tax=Gemmata palustris TaxID=2822762 RepID=A0ABS5BVR9_9BACT|nr:glycosyltransferase [Gemmata palustris]MBP3957826.1 glycosyltransferase [Gemmata palustris]